MRQNFSSGGPYEAKVGYSRTVRVGDGVFVSGCTAMRDGVMIGVGDAYAQAVQALANVEAGLALAGATLAEVTRTRVYLVGADSFDDAGRAHGEVFGAIRPANTTVVVAGLAHPDMLVEIEADAIIGASS